jgi:hypothetical protein
MIEAFVETFPGAPSNNVATAGIGKTWLEAKVDADQHSKAQEGMPT